MCLTILLTTFYMQYNPDLSTSLARNINLISLCRIISINSFAKMLPSLP